MYMQFPLKLATSKSPGGPFTEQPGVVELYGSTTPRTI